MKDYVVTALYEDVNNNTQQELFEVSAVSAQSAESAIKRLLLSEGAIITYLKVK